MGDTRTRWPSARHLQQAADLTREPDPNLDPEQEFYTTPLGDWLDQVANDMACWAPFRDHEGGYRPWRTATRAAHGVLELPDADTCTVCHPPRRTSAPTPAVKRADRTVAYRSRVGTGGLRCLEHAPLHPERNLDWMALAADDLEDGGICSVCGRDVLITKGQTA